jgi:hypothetical protein
MKKKAEEQNNIIIANYDMDIVYEVDLVVKKSDRFL